MAELFFTVALDEAESADVAVDLEGNVLAGDVIDALASRLRMPRGLAAVDLGRRAAIPRERPFGELDIANGTTLRIGPGGATAATADAEVEVEVVVVGGPSAGARAAIPADGALVGRERGVGLHLDDPGVSAAHLLVRTDGDDALVTDRGSRNRTWIGGERIDAPRLVRQGAPVRLGRSLIEVRPARGPRRADQALAGEVAFNRPPRMARASLPDGPNVAAPPGDPVPTRMPPIATSLGWLLPAAIGVLVTGNLLWLAFAIGMPVQAALSYWEQRRTGRREFARDERAFRERLGAAAGALDRALGQEADLRRQHAPDAASLLDRVATRDPSLWERRPGDDDFGMLRLGSAEVSAHARLSLEAGGSTALREEAAAVSADRSMLHDVPVTVTLGDIGGIGICGADGLTDATARWLVAQLVTLHSPRDLSLALAIGEARRAEWDWLKWLPHARDAVGRQMSGVGADAAGALLGALAATARERGAARPPSLSATRPSSEAPRGQMTVVVVDETAARGSALRELLDAGPTAGFAVIWIGRDANRVPGGCGAVVQLDADLPRLRLTLPRMGEQVEEVSADRLSVGLAGELARDLAPLRDSGAEGEAARLPARVSWLELVELPHIDLSHVTERWRRSSARGTLDALIGVARDGRLHIDLRRDGPHALVAGTTGAGKSELLQTLVAALAVEHPPERLTFLLIDYKGGAAFKDCVALPHTVGIVTDLDGALAERALVSLEAELRRREGILREAGARSLLELEARDPSATPPSLVILIDEFATLVAEVPEFVEGIVSIAQRGRSLGLHLVLATQRPSGVVTQSIRANTNLRIALRVTDEADATDVIDAASAAHLPRELPGRAFLRTGHGELTEFQAGYVGGQTATTPRISIRPFDLDPVTADAPPEAGGAGRDTDLHRIAEAVIAAARAAGSPQPRSPWVEPLPVNLPLGVPDEAVAARDPATAATIGLRDEPELQRQVAHVLELDATGSLLVLGAGGAGKTTLLRTIATALARRLPPSQLHIYAVDFATRGLTALEPLPQVGAIVGGDQTERVERLFRTLTDEVARRKALLAGNGQFSIADQWRQADASDRLPRILVLLDGYEGFSDAFERVDHGRLVEQLPRLVTEGRALGVHVVVTAERRGAVPGALATALQARYVMRLADAADIGSGTIGRLDASTLPPGRVIVDDGLQVQIGVVGRDGSAPSQSAAIAEIGRSLAAEVGEQRPPPIGTLPERVDAADLPAEVHGHPVLGIGDARLAPCVVELDEGHFLVAGPYRSGRSTALAQLAHGLRAAHPDAEIILLAPRGSPFAELGLWDEAHERAEALDRLGPLAERLAADDRERSRPAVVVIDDAEELLESIGASAFEAVARRGRELGLVILAAVERQAARRAYGGWLAEVRKASHGLLLDPDVDLDGDLLGVRLPRRAPGRWPAGRGYLVERGAVGLVQVAEGQSS